MKSRQWLGTGILAAVVFVAGLWWVLRPTPAPAVDTITITGYAGNLKIPLLENPEVAAILKDRYGLIVNAEGRPTTEMLCKESLDDVDFLWAGDQSQIGIYEKCRGRSDPFRSIFFSPMVIYSWDDTAQALVDRGVARQDVDGTYTVDMTALAELTDAGSTWIDLGFEHRPKRVFVNPTDPDKSNGGRLFAGLLGNTMNCMQVMSDSDVDSLRLPVHDYFALPGYLEPSSAELFRLYLTSGEGAYPLVALTESQIIEFLVANPDSKQAVTDEVRMLYPEPTVLTTHPLIALTDGGERLMAALQDPEIQSLGWQITGFRPLVPGVEIDLTAAAVPGLKGDVTSVIDMPANPVMDQILAAIDTRPTGEVSPRRDCAPATTGAATPAGG